MFIIQGIDQRCTLIEKCLSKDLAAKWLNTTSDRTDKTVPISATELRTIQILKPVVDHAENMKRRNNIQNDIGDVEQQVALTPPTIASSVPAIPEFGVHRAGSLPTPYGAPRTFTPRRATQAPQQAQPKARVLQSKRQRTLSPRTVPQPPNRDAMGQDEFIERSKEFVRQTAENLSSPPLPIHDRGCKTPPVTEEGKEKEDKELDESIQMVQDQFGVAPGHHVPGLSLEAATGRELAQRKSPLPSPTSIATAEAPPEAASEAGKHDFSDFEQFKDFDKSSRVSLVRSTSPIKITEDGPARRRRSLSARSHSKGSNKIRVKSESDEEPPPSTDGWLPVTVNSPTSPAEEEVTNKVRSPSLVPDYSGEDEPEIIHEREDETSPPKSFVQQPNVCDILGTMGANVMAGRLGRLHRPIRHPTPTTCRIADRRRNKERSRRHAVPHDATRHILQAGRHTLFQETISCVVRIRPRQRQ